MFKKVKKKWAKLLFFLVILSVILGFNFPLTKIVADTVNTSVTVANSAPSFTSGPQEDPVSSSSSPTNAGSNVTFKAIATDSNGDNYYLAICKTNAITAGTGGGAPTCNGGSWCISSSTASGSEASCSYTTSASDSESNDWYAFVCDAASSDQQCSSSSQGSGDSGSPFKVNHRPSFTAFSDDSPKDPGATVTWTTTASDSDTDGTSDTVTLYVCKTNSFTSGSSPSCNGGEWCHSSASSSNPSCTYDIPTPYQDKDYSAYGFIVDNHGFAASGGSQGTDSTLTVSNVAPSISASSIQLLDTDESGNLTLTTSEGETTGFKVKFTVTDNNSCQNASGGDEIASAIINVYRSGVGQASCDESSEYNANNCYPDAYTSWNPSCSQDSGSCTGATDSDATWTCTFPLQYHADPTVGSSSSDSPWYNQNWLVSVKATDDDGADSGLVEDSDGNEMDTFLSYDVTQSAISYGSLSPGGESAEQTTTIKATGNVGLDEELSSHDDPTKDYDQDYMCTDYPDCTDTGGEHRISVSQEHYDLTSGVAWSSMSGTLSSTATEVELNCPKTTTTGSPATKSTYWKIKIPSTQPSGSYSGKNDIVGVTGEATDW